MIGQILQLATILGMLYLKRCVDKHRLNCCDPDNTGM